MQRQQDIFSTEEILRILPLLVNSLDQPIIIIDFSGQILYANRVIADAFGWKPEDLIGHSIDLILAKQSVFETVKKTIEQLEINERFFFDINIKSRPEIDVDTHVAIIKLIDNQKPIACLIFEPQNNPDYQQIKTANKILTEVDHVLGDEVDYEAMLIKMAHFAVPQLADMCAIHVIQVDNSVELMAFAAEKSINNEGIYKWLEDDLPNDETDGLPAVIKSKKPKLVSVVSPVLRAAESGIHSYMILPIINHRQVRGVISFIYKESNRNFNQKSLELAENLAINISIYLEKNRLYKESRELKDELEQRVHERTAELSGVVAQLKQSEEMIQSLFRVSNKLNVTLEVELILDELAKEAIHLVNGESGFAGLRTNGGMTVHKYFHHDVALPFEYTWPIGVDVPGWVLKYKVPYGTSDAANDPLIQHELPINADIRSIICTPILDSVGEVIGYFDIRNKINGEGFTISDQEMLLTLAPVASIAIQNALAFQKHSETLRELKESSKQLEELAAKLESTREEERTRIARELHDQLGQSLTAIKFDLTSLTNHLKNIDEDLSNKGKDILTQLNIMIKTVRRISTELRPGMLDDLGLVASIEWQAGDFQKRTGIECKVTASENISGFTRDQSLAIFRILQETLTNVARYAEAKHVNVVLSVSEGIVNFEIHDDGRGIRPEEISGVQSLGVLGMKERVKHIGGTFTITGVPNEGTSIFVTIPIKQK